MGCVFIIIKFYVSMLWAKETSGMGNTPMVSWWRRTWIPTPWSTRSVIDMDLWFLGSAHGVPTNKRRLRWTSMACRESNSFLKLTHLQLNAISPMLCYVRRVSLFPHLYSCCEILWIAFSRIQLFALKLELNTIQKEQNTQPFARRLMGQWHECARMTSYFSINLNEKQPKCQ